MTTTLSEIDSLSLSVTQEIHVNAPIDVTFDALLEQLGPANEKPDGTPMPMKLEPWPGGRWFRDLGGDNGHFWANVQAIQAADAHRICRATFHVVSGCEQRAVQAEEEGDVTVIHFQHSGFGLIQEQHRKGVVVGWGYMNDQARKRAESKTSKYPNHGSSTQEIPMAIAEMTQSIAQALLAEFEEQAPITRRFLERLPEDKLTWKPHREIDDGRATCVSSGIGSGWRGAFRGHESRDRSGLQFPSAGEP